MRIEWDGVVAAIVLIMIGMAILIPMFAWKIIAAVGLITAGILVFFVSIHE